jgi:hypothetical protein
MSKTIKYAIVFYGTGIFCLLLGLSLDGSSPREDNIKNLFLFVGLSIICLYVGLSGEKPSYGGGVVHKFASIGAGILCGLYSIYLLIKIL